MLAKSPVFYFTICPLPVARCPLPVARCPLPVARRYLFSFILATMRSHQFIGNKPQ